MGVLTRKQRDILIVTLYEKGKTHQDITREAGVSPNTIKATLNKAGLDQASSIASAFELYSQQKDPFRDSYYIRPRS